MIVFSKSKKTLNLHDSSRSLPLHDRSNILGIDSNTIIVNDIHKNNLKMPFDFLKKLAKH
jgi:hypothetical protein